MGFGAHTHLLIRLEALGGKHGILLNGNWREIETFLYAAKNLKVPSLINDVEESLCILGDIQEWCFLNILMPLIQLEEESVTEAATV